MYEDILNANYFNIYEDRPNEDSRDKEVSTKTNKTLNISLLSMCTKYMWNLMRLMRLKIFNLEEKMIQLSGKNSDCVLIKQIWEKSINDKEEPNDIENLSIYVLQNCKPKKEPEIKMLEQWFSNTSTRHKYINIKTSILRLEQILWDKDTRKLHDLQDTLDERTKQIRELQDDLAEELRELLQVEKQTCHQYLHHQEQLHVNRILEQKKEPKQCNSMNARIVQLEEMITSLENYVKEHDIDGLKRKLQDRECRIEQLKKQVVELKKMSRFEENQPAKNTSEESKLFDNKVREEEKDEEMKEVAYIISEEDSKIQKREQQNEFLKAELRKKKQKMKEMEHDISEKDNRIQKYEQQIVEHRNKILEMEKTIRKLKEELQSIEDTDDYKKVQELEMKMSFLKNSHAERVKTIEKLVFVLNEKQKIEHELRNAPEEKMQELENELLQKDNLISKQQAQLNQLEKKLKIFEENDKIKECSTCQCYIYT